ncbi:uncharacterized protein LOC115579882 isoform X2 [Sparus aurata]|uniref:uncharacterized protein LOC115579882 isoform X2 n=1 Tax=Sparus aurata TaxID=8175 RepID=UPI0011C10E81|nr:uncharacterized protein LOC115579882 isoform X2 [Sparus aurata]
MATWNSPSKFEKVDEPEVSRVQTDIQLMCVSTNVMSQKYSSRVNDRGVVAPRQCGVVVICCGRASTLYVCILMISAHIHVAGRLHQPEVARHLESAYAARDEAVPAKERYRLTVHTGGLAIAVMAKLVRQSRAAEQRAAYLSRRLKERDATIRQQAEKLTQLQYVNEAEMLAVVEEVEQQLERVADDGVREVMDVTPRELSRTRSEGGWAGWS